jgi:hypothetical protein
MAITPLERKMNYKAGVLRWRNFASSWADLRFKTSSMTLQPRVALGPFDQMTVA